MTTLDVPSAIVRDVPQRQWPKKIPFTQSAPLAPGQVKLHFKRKTLSAFHNSKVALDASKQLTVV